MAKQSKVWHTNVSFCVLLAFESHRIESATLVCRHRKGQKDIPKVRPGQTISEDMAELFLPPLVSFNAPQRFYYLMGEPISTDPSMARDKVASDALYAKVRNNFDNLLPTFLLLSKSVSGRQEFPILAELAPMVSLFPSTKAASQYIGHLCTLKVWVGVCCSDFSSQTTVPTHICMIT